MASEVWQEGGGISVPPECHNQIDRQMIRHLMGKYGKEELGRLMEEETGRGPLSSEDSASLFSGGSYSTGRPEDTSDIFEASTSNFGNYSDTSSLNGRNSSGVFAPTTRPLHNKSRSDDLRPTSTDDTFWDADDIGAIPNAPKPKGAFPCGFCSEEGIVKTCTRKNDLKRHMEDFHHTNAQWFCRHRGCKMVFDWQTAYKSHLKNTHGGSRMSLDDAKIELCPQTVFACGFENCLQVFESATDADAATTFKEYVGHVVKHFDEGSNSGNWTYSARFRNLLRQSGVMGAWSSSAWREADHGRLRWHPHSTNILRKRLETRHIGDLQLLVHYSISLGSGTTTAPRFRDDFVTPVKGRCQMAIPGHNTAYEEAAQTIPSTRSGSEAFDFRIPRGADSGMIDFYSSQQVQQDVYGQGLPPRTGPSSSRPLTQGTMGSNVPVSGAAPVTPPYAFHHSPTTSPSMFERDQFSLGQQPLIMAGHGPHGGLSPELVHYKSMRGATPETDMEMTDGHLVDASYIPPYQPGFSSSYDSAAGLQSPTLTDGCSIPHHSPFGAYESSHAF